MNDSLISSSIRRGRMRSRLFGAVIYRGEIDRRGQPLNTEKGARQKAETTGVPRLSNVPENTAKGNAGRTIQVIANQRLTRRQESIFSNPVRHPRHRLAFQPSA